MKFLDAWRAFDQVPCVYIQTDIEKRPIRVGRASKGLGRRYWGGTGYAMAAAMHDSGNYVFVAEVTEAMCTEVEEALIWQLRDQLVYNVQGKLKHDQIDVQLKHQGELPTLA